MAAQNLILVGLMAVGKTTIGRLLADAIGWEFVDSDHLIEERAGADIPWIFDVEGETGFRDREQQVLEELTQCSHLVVATGGGAILREANRRVLSARGCVVHLDSSLTRLFERTRKDKKRPLLNSGNEAALKAKLQQLQCERGPLYAEIADYRFTTDNSSPKGLAQRIERQLRADGIVG